MEAKRSLSRQFYTDPHEALGNRSGEVEHLSGQPLIDADILREPDPELIRSKMSRRDWTAVWFMIAGACLMVAVEFGRDFAESHLAPHWVTLLAYAIEHLGAVVVAAMIVRIGLEQAQLERSLEEMSKAVRQRVAIAFKNVDMIVKAVDLKVKHIDAELEAIQTITGGNLYGARLEDEGRKEITKLLNSNFYRPEYNLTLTLTPVANGEIVEVKMDVFYLLENISKEDQLFSIIASLENILYTSKTAAPSKPSRFERVEFGPNTSAGIKQAALQPVTFDRPEVDKLEQEKILKNVQDELVFEYRPELKMAPREIYFVKICAIQEMRESELFVWNMQVVTQLVTVTVQLKGDLNNDTFSVKMRPIDPEKYKDLTPKDSVDTLKWEINGPILPRQGMRIWWSRKTAPASETSPSISSTLLDHE